MVHTCCRSWFIPGVCTSSQLLQVVVHIFYILIHTYCLFWFIHVPVRHDLYTLYILVHTCCSSWFIPKLPGMYWFIPLMCPCLYRLCVMVHVCYNFRFMSGLGCGAYRLKIIVRTNTGPCLYLLQGQIFASLSLFILDFWFIFVTGLCS